MPIESAVIPEATIRERKRMPERLWVSIPAVEMSGTVRAT